ncbi:MAG TPA: hypothetical protein VM513_01705 [Kofleriaceae bacterium]|nr:hypothetical protein [Kofleriaceae bacterium]
MKTRWFALPAVVMTAVLAVTWIGCTDREPSPAPATRLAEPSDVIDENLMISLLQAKNFHRKAKVYMSDGNLVAATASVRQILSLQFPKGAPEADDVRLDARALLAKLLVGQGQLEEAMRTVAEGIASSQRESFFVANLYSVQGEIHQARAAQLEGEAAKEEKRLAIASYDKSIAINERLQKQLMEEK